jgi:4-diphosphocytidyl-2-C-methyl-D-erythritol kinase
LKIALPARAKLNLDLEVIAHNADGFHQLRTTFQAIALHDLLEFETARETTFTSSGLQVGQENNSVITAHRALERAANRTLPVRIHLHKQIPAGSGMGGASADAATTLRALKVMHALDVDLAPIAREVGSDVPFFLRGGRAHAEGRGERLAQLPHEPAWFAIAWPGIELSTADVYHAWDEIKGEGPNHLRRAAEQVDPSLKAFAASLGPGWQMTGSGSAFYKRTNTEEEGRQAIGKLDCWTAVTRAVGAWA